MRSERQRAGGGATPGDEARSAHAGRSSGWSRAGGAAGAVQLRAGTGREPLRPGRRAGSAAAAEGEDTPCEEGARGVCQGSCPREGGPVTGQPGRGWVSSRTGADRAVFFRCCPSRDGGSSPGGEGLAVRCGMISCTQVLPRELARCLHLCSHGAVVHRQRGEEARG